MVEAVILANDTEINYAKQNGLNDSLNLTIAPFIKRITSINRTALEEKSTKLVNQLNGFIDKHETSKVFFFAQFNKGDSRSQEELKAVNEIQFRSNLDTFVFQESDEGNTLEEFKTEFKTSEKFLIDKEIFAVLGIRSKSIEDKIDFLLQEGVLNFIIRGGEYDNTEKWMEIRESIQRLNGKFLISVHKRWNKDKVSYLKYALELGCDYTFHEKPTPFPMGAMSILNLNDNFVYQLISVDGDYGVNITEENNYSFSRARALLKAQELVPRIELLQVSQTKL